MIPGGWIRHARRRAAKQRESGHEFQRIVKVIAALVSKSDDENTPIVAVGSSVAYRRATGDIHCLEERGRLQPDLHAAIAARRRLDGRAKPAATARMRVSPATSSVN